MIHCVLSERVYLGHYCVKKKSPTRDWVLWDFGYEAGQGLSPPREKWFARHLFVEIRDISIVFPFL